MNEPTDLEKYTFETFEALVNLVAKSLKNGYSKTSKATKSACKDAGNDLTSAVKPIYSYNKEGKAVAYLKLHTKGTGNKMKCWTKIYNSEDYEQPFGEFLSDIGVMPDLTTAKIILDLQSIYFGSHGNTPFGASIQLRVREVKLTRIEYNKTSLLYDKDSSSSSDEESGDDEESSDEESGDEENGDE